jgi:hypothetical protein
MISQNKYILKVPKLIYSYGRDEVHDSWVFLFNKLSVLFS